MSSFKKMSSLLGYLSVFLIVFLYKCFLGFIYGAMETECLAAAVLATLHKFSSWGPITEEELDGVCSCLRDEQKACNQEKWYGEDRGEDNDSTKECSPVRVFC